MNKKNLYTCENNDIYKSVSEELITVEELCLAEYDINCKWRETFPIVYDKTKDVGGGEKRIDYYEQRIKFIRDIMPKTMHPTHNDIACTRILSIMLSEIHNDMKKQGSSTN